MEKIQYGIAGFFSGAFIGLLLALIERRLIDSTQHPTLLFIVIALTVIFCGLIGIAKGLRMERKKNRRK